jgi:hypothetical protein
MAPAPDESAKSESPEPMLCWLLRVRAKRQFSFFAMLKTAIALTNFRLSKQFSA